MTSDGELLQQYVGGSQEAFQQLVRRHINVVYLAARRRVGGNAHTADDVTQRVFNDLARKAGSLSDRPNLAGWLYTSTRFAAAAAVRSERRRRTHEEEASAMHAQNTADTPLPPDRLDPFLDEVMDILDDRDREAVLLHFFEGFSFPSIGEALSVSPDAARMRVNRALDRLRAELERRGVSSTAGALGATLSAQAGMTAPAGMAGSVASSAMNSAMLSGASTAIFSGALARILLVLAGAAVVVTAGIALTAYFRDRDAPVPPLIIGAPAPEVAVPLANPPVAAGEGNMDSLEIVPELPPLPPPPANAGAAAQEVFAAMSEAEKQVLKHLWGIVRAYGVPAEGRGRWVFNVAPEGAKYAVFASGGSALQARGLALGTLKGALYLNSAGIALAEANATALAAFPEYFKEVADTASMRDVRFADLSAIEKDLLKRLWEFWQQQPDPQRPLAMRINAGTPLANDYFSARALLMNRGLAGTGQRGDPTSALLTTLGRWFCQQNAAELAAHPSFYGTVRARGAQ